MFFTCTTWGAGAKFQTGVKNSSNNGRVVVVVASSVDAVAISEIWNYHWPCTALTDWPTRGSHLQWGNLDGQEKLRTVFWSVSQCIAMVKLALLSYISIALFRDTSLAYFCDTRSDGQIMAKYGQNGHLWPSDHGRQIWPEKGWKAIWPISVWTWIVVTWVFPDKYK